MHKLIDYRDTWADCGIHIIKPRSGGCSSTDPENSIVAQSELIAREMPAICEELGAKTVLWDTLTTTVLQIVQEYAQAGLHKGNNTKRYRVVIGNETLTDRLPPAMQDWGWAQVHLRDAVRDRMLQDPRRNYHLIHVMHQETAKKPLGKDPDTKQQIYAPTLHGPNGGGPGSVEMWATQYQALNRVYVEGEGDKAQRFVQLGPFSDKNGVPIAARTNVGGNLPSKMAVPSSFDGAVATWAKIAEAMGLDMDRPERTGYYSGTLYGLMGSGKTRWASALLGLPGALPAVYVAADGGSEYLRSFWTELKQAAA